MVVRANVLECLALVADLPTVRNVADERLPYELVDEKVVEVAWFNLNADRAEGCAVVVSLIFREIEKFREKRKLS